MKKYTERHWKKPTSDLTAIVTISKNPLNTQSNVRTVAWVSVGKWQQVRPIPLLLPEGSRHIIGRIKSLYFRRPSSTHIVISINWNGAGAGAHARQIVETRNYVLHICNKPSPVAATIYKTFGELIDATDSWFS